jgi:hypothetical protein
MDDDLDDQHRAAEHHDNFQSSGEDEMSDWFFGADAATLSKFVQWGWLLDWPHIAEFVCVSMKVK